VGSDPPPGWVLRRFWLQDFSGYVYGCRAILDLVCGS